MGNIIQKQPFESFLVTEPVVQETVSFSPSLHIVDPLLPIRPVPVVPGTGPVVTDPPHTHAEEGPHTQQSLIQDIDKVNRANIIRVTDLTVEASRYSRQGKQESLNSNYFSSLTLGVQTNSIDTNAVQSLIQDNIQILQQPEQLASGSIFNY